MSELADVLQPVSAALFILIQKMAADKLLDEFKGVGGKVLRTSLDHSKEQQLRDALVGVLKAETESQAG